MKTLLLALFPHFARHRWRLLLGFFCVIIHNYLKVYSTLVIGQSFNLIENGIKNGEFQTVFPLAIENALWYFGLAIVSGIFLFFTRQTIIVMSRKIEYDLKNQIYEHYQTLDLLFFRKKNIGDLMNRISEDVGKVRMFIGPSILYGLNLSVTGAVVIYFMWQKNIELTLYCLLPLPIMSVLIYYISSKMHSLNHQAQQQQSQLASISQENFSGIRVIKAYEKLNFMEDFFLKNSQIYRQKMLKLTKIEAWFMPSIMTLVGLSTILSIYLGGLKVISGELRVGDIAEFVVYINLLTWPFVSLGWITSVTQAAIVSQQRINEFLKEKPQIFSTSESIFIDQIEEIHFKNLSLRYTDTQIQALDQLDFKVKKGEMIGILGHTGSGKSSLMQLILRLVDPSEGKILINQKELTTFNIEALREKMAYIPQDVFLFSDTIYNNIAFGVSNPTQEEVEWAAKMAEVHDNIMNFPQQYQTILGERGINLSGGQKQRISIARALLKKNAQILILDDALSAVDTQTERNILQNLTKIKGEKIIFIISQRVSSVIDADQILVLLKGKIAQQGRHHHLLEDQSGFYYKQYIITQN